MCTTTAHHVILSGSVLKDISREVEGDEAQVAALSGSREVINVLPVKPGQRGKDGEKSERFEGTLKHSRQTDSTELLVSTFREVKTWK